MNKTKKNKTIILKDKNLSSTEAFQKKLTSDYKILAKNKKVKQSDVDNFKYNKEELDNKDIGLNSSYSYLYPNLNDPNFNIKISEKKEFLDTRYDGEIKDAVAQSDILCNAEFEVLALHLL
jgi:regulatory protein YycI of two-component signal transduction system YycFG